MRLQAAYLLLLLPVVLTAKIKKDSTEDFDIDNLSDNWEPLDIDQQPEPSTDSKAIKEALEKFIKLKQSTSSESDIPNNSFTIANSQKLGPNSQFIIPQDQQGLVNFNPNNQQLPLSQGNINFGQLSASTVPSNTPFSNSAQFSHANEAQLLSQQQVSQNIPSYSNRPTFNEGSETNPQFTQFNQRISTPTQQNWNQGNVAQFLNRDATVQNQFSAQLPQFALKKPANTATLLAASNAAPLNANIPLYLQSQPNYLQQTKAQVNKPSDLEGFLQFLQAQEAEMQDEAEQPKMEMKEPEKKAPPPPPKDKPAPKPEYSTTDIHNPDSFLLKDNEDFTIARDNNGKPILLSDVDANGHIPAHMDYSQYAPAESHQISYLHASSNGNFENLTSEEQDSRYFQLLNAQSNGKFKNVSTYQHDSSFTPDFTTKQVFPNERQQFEYVNKENSYENLPTTYHPHHPQDLKNIKTFNEYETSKPTDASNQRYTGHFLDEGPPFVTLPQNGKIGSYFYGSDKAKNEKPRETDHDYKNFPFEFLNANTNFKNVKDKTLSNQPDGFIPTKDPNIFIKRSQNQNDFESFRYDEKNIKQPDITQPMAYTTSTGYKNNNNNGNHFLSKSPLTYNSESNLEKSEQEGQNLGKKFSYTTKSNNNDNLQFTQSYAIKNSDAVNSKVLPTPNSRSPFYQRDDDSFSTVLSEILSTTSGFSGSTIPSEDFRESTPTETSSPYTILTTKNIRSPTVTSETKEQISTTNIPTSLAPSTILDATDVNILSTDKSTETPLSTTYERSTTRLPPEYFTTELNNPYTTRYTTVPVKSVTESTIIPSTRIPATQPQPPNTTQFYEITTQSYTGDGEQGLPSYNPPGLPLQIQGSHLSSYYTSNKKTEHNYYESKYPTQSSSFAQQHYNSNLKLTQKPLKDSVSPIKPVKSPLYTNTWLNNNYLSNPLLQNKPALPNQTPNKPLQDVPANQGSFPFSQNYFSQELQSEIQYQNKPMKQFLLSSIQNVEQIPISSSIPSYNNYVKVPNGQQIPKLVPSNGMFLEDQSSNPNSNKVRPPVEYSTYPSNHFSSINYPQLSGYSNSQSYKILQDYVTQAPPLYLNSNTQFLKPVLQSSNVTLQSSYNIPRPVSDFSISSTSNIKPGFIYANSQQLANFPASLSNDYANFNRQYQANPSFIAYNQQKLKPNKEQKVDIDSTAFKEFNTFQYRPIVDLGTSSTRGPMKPDDTFSNFASSFVSSQKIRHSSDNLNTKPNDVTSFGYANPPSSSQFNKPLATNVSSVSTQKINISKVHDNPAFNKYNTHYNLPDKFVNNNAHTLNRNHNHGSSTENTFSLHKVDRPSQFYPSSFYLHSPEPSLQKQNIGVKNTQFQTYAPSTYNQYQTSSHGHLSVPPGSYQQTIQSDPSYPQGTTSQGYLSLPPGLFLQSDSSVNSNQPIPVHLAEAEYPSKDYPSIPSAAYQQVSQNGPPLQSTNYNPAVQNDATAGPGNQGYPALPPALYLQGQYDVPVQYNPDKNNQQSYLGSPGLPPGVYLQGSQNDASASPVQGDTQIKPKPEQGYVVPLQELQHVAAVQFKPTNGAQGSPVNINQSYQIPTPVLQQVQNDATKPEIPNGVASFNEEDLTPIHLPAENCSAVFEVLEDRQSVLGVKAMPGEADCRLTFVSPSTSRLALQVIGLDLPQGDDACKLASVSVFSQMDGRNLLLNQLCGSVKESPVMLTEGQSALVTVQSEMGTQRPGFTVVAFLW